jgi:RNA polymerase primary sigma factor
MGSQLDTALGDYLKQIKHFALLTAEEERELGGRIRAASQAERQLQQREITVQEYERSQSRAVEAREQMIRANLRLVISVAKNFRNRGLPMEDLVEEGNVGLVHAVDRFDPTVGSRFSTYASYWIDQAIRRAVQSSTQIIHIPSYLMEQIGHMKLAMRELEEKLGRPPSIPEISEAMDISPRKAQRISQAIRACTCPTQAGVDENGAAVTDNLPDTRTPQPHEGVFSKSDTHFVEQMLSRITEREARLLKMRFGMHDKSGKPMTLKQIGVEIGLTRERVRQIEQEAKAKLEELVREHL